MVFAAVKKRWATNKALQDQEDRMTFLGETPEGWREFAEEVGVWALWWAFRIVFWLAVLYGLVKFVKWAWEH
jgi:hypothetical protein